MVRASKPAAPPDVVERLRAAAFPSRSGIMPSRHLYAEAADEIERLRDKLTAHGTGCGCRWKYDSEKDLDGTQYTECAYHADQKADLRAANKALVEALGALRDFVGGMSFHPAADSERADTLVVAASGALRLAAAQAQGKEGADG